MKAMKVTVKTDLTNFSLSPRTIFFQMQTNCWMCLTQSIRNEDIQIRKQK